MAKEDNVWSGVTVLEAWFCIAGRSALIEETGAGSGVCHEKEGVAPDVLGGAVVLLLLAGWGAAHSFIKSPLPFAADLRPDTSVSKSVSSPFGKPPLLEDAAPDRAAAALVPMALLALELPISCNFLVCSRSILPERVLINDMNAWNCCRFNSGPRLKVHSTGKTSIARKSVSATSPTCLKTLRAAIMTPGSFVLMPLSRGTTFSCTVNLSKITLLLDDAFLSGTPMPLRSSSLPSGVPPQRV